MSNKSINYKKMSENHSEKCCMCGKKENLWKITFDTGFKTQTYIMCKECLDNFSRIVACETEGMET